MSADAEDLQVVKAAPINMDDLTDVKRWCIELNATEVDLKRAVARVGTMPAAVRAFLLSETKKYAIFRTFRPRVRAKSLAEGS